MGKGSKSSGKNYTSKGERKSSMSTKVKDPGQRMLNQIDALKKGKNIVWSLPNISKDGKVLPNTRVKVNGKEYIAKMKHNGYQHKDSVD
jgi:hypothetical protein